MRKILIGILLFLISGTILFILINGLEYKLWMGTTARSIIFFMSLLITISLFTWFIVLPLFYILRLRKGMSDEHAALEVSRSFPELQDKLLNTLQLNNLSLKNNELLKAAIDKKASAFKHIPFIRAVDFSISKRYATVLGFIIVCLTLVSFINPNLFRDSTERIVKFNQEFTPEAPFNFVVSSSLKAFKGEDFEIRVDIRGSSLPEKVILHLKNGQKIRLNKAGNNSFRHLFTKIQRTVDFQLEGAGFFSQLYTLEVNERPDLLAMSILIKSPEYTGGERRIVSNTGNITVLEGSSVSWDFSTLAADSINFFLGTTKVENTRTEENSFRVEQRLFSSETYSVELFNQFGKNSSELAYNINIIKDERPTISAEYFPDSLQYRFITLAGNVVDDHGFTLLTLNYRKDGNPYQSIPLELSPNTTRQSFYASWNIDSLKLAAGDRLEFHVSVSDNDQVNGYKSARSRSFVMQIPTGEEIEKIIDKKSEVVENQIDKTKEEAESINDRLNKIEEKLKTDQKFEWQERKQLNDLIKDRESLEKEIEELQKQHKDLQRSSNQFNKRSEQAKQQNEKLQNLLDELLDEKTRELYEQLKELLKDKDASSDQVREQLNDIQKNEKNLERELDRALELFKRLKMESALEQNMQKLDSLQQKQEALSKKGEEELGNEELQEQQKEIQENFEEFRKKMDEVEQLNQELKRPEALQDFELEERQISKELREIQEQLDQQNADSENSSSKNQGAEQQNQEPSQKEERESEKGKEGEQENNREQQSQSPDQQKQQSGRQQVQQKQKKASERMKQLTKQLGNMQSGMQMEMMQANLDQLRDILDNLVKLSFNQEELMTEMREVNQSDPRFLELSQAQLKLKDDAKVIQDSLLSLAKRVVQISSFITREVGSINENIDEALSFLKDRNRGRGLSSQQFAMTSINNLALLLDDTMQQMQMAMSEAMGNQSKGQQQQKGLPDLQQMQQQLGQQMNELKGSGKQGRELSEELARLAAEQEMIRRQLEMIKQAEDGQPGGPVGDNLQRAIDQMEQNEIDLVNKRLSQQLINRQKSIETRLLEAEKAQREQEMEEEREAQSPSVFSREIPPEFEEYLKMKQKEIELLKTIPLELNPFYKKEVNDYFRRISSDKEDDR